MAAEGTGPCRAAKVWRILLSTHRHVLVRGRVQGVGFRAWTERVALSHGLKGWVRNRHDGAVEAVFIGADEAVTAMVEACRSGPHGAFVEALDQREASPGEVRLRRGDELFSVLATA
jgi:acylphosphatase